jgi:HSP20 family protein
MPKRQKDLDRSPEPDKRVLKLNCGVHNEFGSVFSSSMMEAEMAEKENEVLSARTPLQKISQLENRMDRMLENLLRRSPMSLLRPEQWSPGSLLPFQSPAVDIYEDEDQVVVKAEVPGIAKEDLDINLSGSTLTIKGEKKEEQTKKVNYYYRERSHGSFTRIVELPAKVNGKLATASFENGVLEIGLPKTEEAKKKVAKIRIE